MFTYKGYVGHVELDIEAEILFGRVLDISDVVTFQGKTIEECRKAFEDSVDDYLEFCEELGRKPNKSFSGKLHYRTSPEQHRKLYIAAHKSGQSINTWIDRVIAEAVEKELIGF